MITLESGCSECVLGEHPCYDCCDCIGMERHVGGKILFLEAQHS